MDSKRSDEQYSERETAKRRDEVLKRMLNTPPRPRKGEAAPKGGPGVTRKADKGRRSKK